MAVTLKTIDTWSEKDQKITSFDVFVEDEVEVIPEVSVEVEPPKVIVIRHGDEFFKFSPNTTDEELQKQIDEINQEKS